MTTVTLIKSLIKSVMVVVRRKNGYPAVALKEICLIGKYESILVTNLDLNCFDSEKCNDCNDRDIRP